MCEWKCCTSANVSMVMFIFPASIYFGSWETTSKYKLYESLEIYTSLVAFNYNVTLFFSPNIDDKMVWQLEKGESEWMCSHWVKWILQLVCVCVYVVIKKYTYCLVFALVIHHQPSAVIYFVASLSFQKKLFSTWEQSKFCLSEKEIEICVCTHVI